METEDVYEKICVRTFPIDKHPNYNTIEYKEEVMR